MPANFGIWVGCAVGQGFYNALRIQNMLRSPKNECDTLREWLHVYGLETAAKITAVFAVQGIWLYSSASFASLLAVVGLPTPPLISWTAFGWGLLGAVLVDSLTEKYPVLRRALKGNGDATGTP